MAATSYVYTVSTDIPSGLVSVARLRKEIELSTILTQIDYNAGGITLLNDGEGLTIWFKDALSSGDKQTLDGSTLQTPNSPATAGSILGDHSGLALPDDPQDVNVTGGSVDAVITGGTLDGDGKIKSPDGAVFLGDATNPLRTDPTGSTIQPISAASLPLPAGAATEATLATLTTPSDTQPVSAVSLPLPTGAATEATLATRATEATLTALSAKVPALGQAAMAASQPVAIASDQSEVASKNAAASQVDGHSVSIGATTDTDTANTMIGRLKKLVSLLPAALVGGRLDINLGSWLGSTVPVVAQKTMDNSIPVVVASDQSEVASKNAATSQADGHSVTLGTTSDADTATTVVGRLQKVVSLLAGGLPSSLGRKVEALSLSVALADEQLGTIGSAAPVRGYPLAAKQQGATTLRAAAAKYDTVEQEYRILVDAKTVIAPPDPPANTTAVTYKSASEVAGSTTAIETFAIADGVTLTIQEVTIGGEGDPNQRGSQITVEYYDGTTYHEVDIYFVQSSSQEFFPSTSKAIDGTSMVGGTGKLIRISRQRLGAGAAIIRCVIRGYTS